jgi:hypothetical protein
MLSGPEYAQVVAVTAVTESVKTPREECHDKVVTRQRPVEDTHQIAGTVIGAVAGGVLGNVIGGGGKTTAAKIAGAAAGGYAGNKTQETTARKFVRFTCPADGADNGSCEACSNFLPRLSGAVDAKGRPLDGAETMANEGKAKKQFAVAVQF